MIRCIVVDDEQPARELIALHLTELVNLQLVAAFDNPLAAFSYLQNNAVDLMFLDIRMPKISGIDLVKSLKNPPKIILTTAYREFAVEAFELDVMDYLVKPITRERFIKAISKFSFYDRGVTEKKKIEEDSERPYIFLKVNRVQTKIFLHDILYFEGLKDYIRVHLKGSTIIIYERLSYMEEKLPENKFVRMHKSFIVSLDKIKKYSAEQVTIEGGTLPVGRMYKNNFLKIAADFASG